MTILLGGTVWEGLSTEPRPTYEQGARDGHFYKELDTGESYIRLNGVFTFVNLGLSFIKATKSGKIVTDETGFYHVDFTTHFINDQYTVALSCQDQPTNIYIVDGFGSTLVNGTYTWDGTTTENDQPLYANILDNTILLVYNGSGWELLQRTAGPWPIQASYYANTSEDPLDESWAITDNGVAPIGTVVASTTEFKIPVAYKLNLTTEGFDIQTRDTHGLPFIGITVAWLATRDYNP